MGREIHNSLLGVFQVVVFDHVKRDCSEVVHTLAYMSTLEFSTRVWARKDPDCILDIVVSKYFNSFEFE